MKLRAKISPKYLDQIVRGEKAWEYRQIETITLVCPDGRIAEFGVGRLDIVSAEIVAKYHPDVPWDLKKPVLAMKLVAVVVDRDKRF